MPRVLDGATRPRRWRRRGCFALFLASLVFLVTGYGSTSQVRGPYAGKIVFYSDRDGPFEIYVMKADGSGARRLTTTGKPKDVGTSKEQAALLPEWSPDGKQIVFQSGPPDIGLGQIYVMNANGSGKHRLTTEADNNILPAWSPTGSRIAFVSDRDADAQIYVMDATGRNQRPVTTQAEYAVFPTWAPDGKRIAFTCVRNGRTAICSVSVSGGRVATILTAPRRFKELSAADWSPDGRKIVFQSQVGKNFDVYVVGADGKGLRRLTTDAANDSYPAWSPDGRHIVFSSNRSGGTELYVMNADGSSQTRLTNKAGHDEGPDWARGNP